MEVSKKRAAEGAKSGSPKKQRVNKKGSAGKGKKPRDSSKPKRPMSAYFFFLEWFRNDLKQKKKDGEDAPTKIGDVAKLAGEKWKTMSNDDKKPFVALHEKARKSYDEQVKQLKPARDETKPKKPRTAFFFFLEEFRGKMKGEADDAKKVPSLAGEEWRAMDDAKKQKYVDMAAEAKKEYDVQMKDYVAKNPKKASEKVTKKSKARVKEDSESEEEEEEEDEEEEEENDDEEDDEEEEDDDSD